MLKQLICLTLFFVGGEHTITRDSYSCFNQTGMEDKVRLYNQMILTCPENYVCNVNGPTGWGTPPCTLPKCSGDWTCTFVDNATYAVIGSLQFKCPPYTTCHLPSNNSCIPCVATKCPTSKDVKCDATNPGVFRNGSVWNNCPDGQVCNTRWEEPCTPCIGDNFGVLL